MNEAANGLWEKIKRKNDLQKKKKKNAVKKRKEREKKKGKGGEKSIF